VLTLEYIRKIAGLDLKPEQVEAARAKIDNAYKEQVVRLKLEYVEDKQSGDVRIVNVANDEL